MQWPYVLLDDFLEPDFAGELLALAERAAPHFTRSTVSTGDTSYRASSVLYSFDLAVQFRYRVDAMLLHALPRLGIERFAPSDIECQLTAHGDGHYFRPHNDNGSPDTASRILTYVYYFHRDPKAFEGGEFRMIEPTGAAADLTPANNSILFFPSGQQHEVRQVRVPSGRFVDGRFTVNGWVRR